RQRITEGNTQFEDIDPSLVKGQRERSRGGQVGIAGANIRDKPFASRAFKRGKSIHNSVHRRGVSRFRFHLSSGNPKSQIANHPPTLCPALLSHNIRSPCNVNSGSTVVISGRPAAISSP